MDPFLTASTPAPRLKRRPRREVDTGDDDSNPFPGLIAPHPDHDIPELKSASMTSAALGSTASLASLRRSAGLLNLKIGDATVEPESPAGPDLQGNHDLKHDLLSLKRPLPFATVKPTKQWGPLGRPATTSIPPAQSSKRMHTYTNHEIPAGFAGHDADHSSADISVADHDAFDAGSPDSTFLSLDDHDDFPRRSNGSHLYAGNSTYGGSSSYGGSHSTFDSLHTDATSPSYSRDNSFQCAKPVQTAFASAGLKSKKQAPRTPKPRVPETPVKRQTQHAEAGLGKPGMLSGHELMTDHGSPFPGLRAPKPLLADLSSSALSSTDSLLAPRVLGERSLRTPVDRLQRFSIAMEPSDELDVPDTPTKHGASAGLASTGSPATGMTPAHNSSPVATHGAQAATSNGALHYDGAAPTNTSRPFRNPLPPIPVSAHDLACPLGQAAGNDAEDPRTGAGRQSSEAATMTPGTAVRPRPPSLDLHVLRSADPTDSMSMSPLFDETPTTQTSGHTPSGHTPSLLELAGPYTPSHAGSSPKVGAGLRGPHTSGVPESQSSPRPRRRLRLFGLKEKLPRAPSPKTAPTELPTHTDSVSTTAPDSGATANSGGAATNGTVSAGAGYGYAGYNDSYIPPVPPLRIGTPLGRNPFDVSPKTPANTHFTDPMGLDFVTDASDDLVPPRYVSDSNSSSTSSLRGTSYGTAYGSSGSAGGSSGSYMGSSGGGTAGSTIGSSGTAKIFTGALHGTSRGYGMPPKVPLLHKDDDASLYDAHLISKFDKVQSAANGEFSSVFVVVQGRQRYAVKRTKKPIMSQRDKQRQHEEVAILRALSAESADSHVIQLVSEWEHARFGYIMTEFCENGDLSAFLAAQGRVSRLEEWRVWKIMVEVLHGLAVIHAQNILHLDLKPANVFVSFEGHLKIGDFGMATHCPTPPGFEREGDREYIAPEVLERQQYGKPADIFSVGLMMVEVAANIVLPDNGEHWHRLRSGDLSDAGRLSSGDLATNVSSGLGADLNNSAVMTNAGPPPWAPRFLVDDSYLLDKVVSLMLSPQPEKRPTVAQLLTMPELMLVYQRGQAGAIVYEGEYGPEPEMADETSVWQRA